MNLVKFDINKKKEVYINPDLVTKVIQYNDKNTIINMVDRNSTVIVLHDIRDVISKLTGKSEF